VLNVYILAPAFYHVGDSIFERSFMIDGEVQIPLSALNPSLARMIEDAILFGKIEEIDTLLEHITDHPHVTDELRYGLEGLKHFRAHYVPAMDKFSDSAKKRISRFDNDWSMQLIDMLHEEQEFQDIEGASA